MQSLEHDVLLTGPPAAGRTRSKRSADAEPVETPLAATCKQKTGKQGSDKPAKTRISPAAEQPTSPSDEEKDAEKDKRQEDDQDDVDDKTSK